MPYNSVADSFHTKKLCSRLSSSELRFYAEVCRFVWTFIARCYGWGATSDYRFKISEFAPTGLVDPKFQVQGVTPHQPIFFSEN